MRHVVVIAVALASSGCSFVTVERSRALEDPTAPDPCTTSAAAPVADVALALAAAGAAVFQGVEAEAAAIGCVGQPPGCDKGSGHAAAFFGLLAASATFAVSGTYGAVTTSTCRRSVGLRDRCASGDLAACRDLKPGWQPTPGWPAQAQRTRSASPSSGGEQGRRDGAPPVCRRGPLEDAAGTGYGARFAHSRIAARSAE